MLPSTSFKCGRKLVKFNVFCIVFNFRVENSAKFVYKIRLCDRMWRFPVLWYIDDSSVSHNYSWDCVSLSYEKMPCLVIQDSMFGFPMTGASISEITYSRLSERCSNGSETSVCFCFVRVSASHKFPSIDPQSSTQTRFIHTASLTSLHVPLTN